MSDNVPRNVEMGARSDQLPSPMMIAMKYSPKEAKNILMDLVDKALGVKTPRDFLDVEHAQDEEPQEDAAQSSADPDCESTHPQGGGPHVRSES